MPLYFCCQIRLDAFALLCENHKTSEPIDPVEFGLMRYFILWNLNNQAPSFRQHFIAHIKKVCKSIDTRQWPVQARVTFENEWKELPQRQKYKNSIFK